VHALLFAAAINVHLLYVYMHSQYMPILDGLIHTRASFWIQVMACLSDKDAVYLHECICLRSLYLQESMILYCCEILQLTRIDICDRDFFFCVHFNLVSLV